MLLGPRRHVTTSSYFLPSALLSRTELRSPFYFSLSPHDQHVATNSKTRTATTTTLPSHHFAAFIPFFPTHRRSISLALSLSFHPQLTPFPGRSPLATLQQPSSWNQKTQLRSVFIFALLFRQTALSPPNSILLANNFYNPFQSIWRSYSAQSPRPLYVNRSLPPPRPRFFFLSLFPYVSMLILCVCGDYVIFTPLQSTKGELRDGR